MKLPILLTLAALGLTSGLARADSLSDNPPKSTTICLDTSGRMRPVHCRAQASRIDATEDICICPGGAQQVKVSVCEQGVKPPPESAVLMRERMRMVSHGSVVGATWRGQPICVLPRNQGG